MFPQYNPQQSQVGGSANPAIAQNTSLLGNQPFQASNIPTDFNTTAPSSNMIHPAVQNMIKALQGGK